MPPDATTSRLVVITGPPAIGKTTAAYLLARRLPGTVARISGDVFVLAVSPFEASDDRRAFLLENLVSFIEHARAHAYDWIVIECVIPSDEFLDELIAGAGLAADSVHVFSILASEDAYRRRVEGRLAAQGGVQPEAQLAACCQWLHRIAALRRPQPVDTSAQTPEETAAALLRAVQP